MAKKNNRQNKREMMNRLLCLFEKIQNESLNVKEIFPAVNAVKHPMKMLVIECQIGRAHV